VLELIKSKAREQGLSVNQTIKNILESSLGVKPKNRLARISDFEEFCGVWSKADLSAFNEKTKRLRKVDPEDWR
jgi:hypothetical protein